MRVRCFAIAGALVLLLSAAIQCRAQQGDELEQLKQQFKAMQQMMSEMQAKIEAMEKARGLQVTAPAPAPALTLATPPPQAAGQPALSPALTQRQTVSDNPYGVARVDNAPLDPKMKGFFAIPGTETKMRIGGYTKLDAIHDFNPAGTTDWFVTSTIPIGPVADVSNTEIQVRQTRLNLELRRPLLGDDLRFFFETDFTGSNGQRVLNLRHAYGQWRNLLAGFTFSTFNDMDSLPDTLDFEGPGSAIFQYNPQIRYTWAINKRHSLAFALEQPMSDVPKVMTQINNIQITPNSPWPDVVLRYRYETSRGHLQVGTLLRSVGAWYEMEHADHFCYGFSVGAALTVGEMDNVLFQGNYGRGISRYVNDLGGTGYDLGLDHGMRSIPLPVYGGLLAYEHYWTEKLRSTITYGYLKTDTYYLPMPDNFKSSAYAAANLIYNVMGSLNVGVELLHGNHFQVNGQQGNATRFQFSFQYDFVK